MSVNIEGGEGLLGLSGEKSQDTPIMKGSHVILYPPLALVSEQVAGGKIILVNTRAHRGGSLAKHL